MESSPGRLFACSLNCVVEAKERGRQELDGLEGWGAKGSTCQRIAFPLSSQSSPEEGCAFSEFLLPLQLQLLALSHNPGSSSQKAL